MLVGIERVAEIVGCSLSHCRFISVRDCEFPPCAKRDRSTKLWHSADVRAYAKTRRTRIAAARRTAGAATLKTKPQPIDPALISRREAAKLLGRSLFFFDATRRNALDFPPARSERPNGKIVFDRAEVLNWIEKHKAGDRRRRRNRAGATLESRT